MLTTVSAFIIALALAVSGGGVTAYASQDSLPTDGLYPAKLFFEDAQLKLTHRLESKVELLTRFANRRVDESVELALRGEAIPQEVITRLESQLAAMMQVTAQMDAETRLEAMNYLRINLRDQDQLMTMLGRPDTVDPQLLQLQATLREQHRAVQEDIDEPGQNQTQFRNNSPTQLTETLVPSETPEETITVTPTRDCPNPDCEPKGTGEPGAGPGPGPGDCEVPGACTPEGNGPGPGPGSTATAAPGNQNQGNGNQDSGSGNQNSNDGSGSGKNKP